MGDSISLPEAERRERQAERFFNGKISADGKTARRTFEVVDVRDVQHGAEPAYLIDGLLPAAGLGVVVGLPKSGKSFLLADAMFHVAIGRPWAGRDVLPGSVAYVTSEGVPGFKRRMIAFREHYGEQDPPFGLILVAPDLGHESRDDEELIACLRTWQRQRNKAPLRAVVIDTLARAMNGADENTAKDMSVLVANCERIASALNCIVIVVHHAGRGNESRSRGSNALDGAADVMWVVEKAEGVNRCTIAAMKDGEDGVSWSFRLLRHCFDDAPETSTCTVEIVTEPAFAGRAETSRNKNLGDVPKRLLDIIRKAASDEGGPIPNTAATARGVTRDRLKSCAISSGWWDQERKQDSVRAQFSATLNLLANRRFIGLTKDHVWPL